MSTIVVILVAIAGGVAIVLQGQATAVMDQRAGTTVSVFATYAIGGLVIALVMLALRGARLGDLRGAPWWVYLAGLFGLVIVGSIAYSASRIGLVQTFTVLVVTQFVLSGAIDHFGLLGAEARPLTIERLAGLALLLTGTWLVLR
jgi:transporter family-2 protein